MLAALFCCLSVCPKWVKLRKTHSEKKSVLMLIICSSAVRALELIRSVSAAGAPGQFLIDASLYILCAMSNAGSLPYVMYALLEKLTVSK